MQKIFSYVCMYYYYNIPIRKKSENSSLSVTFQVIKWHCLHKIFYIVYKNNNNYNKIANPDDSREGKSSAISKEHNF